MKKSRGPPAKGRPKYRFYKMKPGDSFTFKDTKPQAVAKAFGSFLATGKYTIRKEGNKYRFTWLKPEGGSDAKTEGK